MPTAAPGKGEDAVGRHQWECTPHSTGATTYWLLFPTRDFLEGDLESPRRQLPSRVRAKGNVSKSDSTAGVQDEVWKIRFQDFVPTYLPTY